jgi:hypothetical protein
MPQIEISDITFSRLQELAVPLVDNNDTVITRLLDAFAQSKPPRVIAGQNGTPSSPEPRKFNAGSPPSLTHTKLLSGKLNGKPIQEVKWNGLLVESIRLAKASARNDDQKLRRLIPVNFVLGKKEIEGYHYIKDIDLSVQGQDADAAWSGAYQIARQLGVAIEAEFQWRSKDAAAFPGVTGKLSA